MILAFFVSFGLFWLYSKLIYSKSVVFHRGLIVSHIMFSAMNSILWSLPSMNLPYWVVIPLMLNSTRIELWYESLMIHANNLAYAQVITVKNALPIVWMFHCSNKAGVNASFVLSILIMDIIHFMLWSFKTIQVFKVPKITTRTSWLTLRTITQHEITTTDYLRNKGF